MTLRTPRHSEPSRRAVGVTIGRRRFLGRVTGGAAACAALPILGPRAARSAQVDENDARLRFQNVSYEGASGPILAYLVMPLEIITGPMPGVVVLHENRGLSDHIRDVARRVALEGFVALAPDLLSPEGGTPFDEAEARALIEGLDPAQLSGNLAATTAYLRSREETTESIGAIGFRWGGGMANALAVADPELAAAVSFYGPPPDPAHVAPISARLLMHFAGEDERINQEIEPARAALEAEGKEFEIHVYEGVEEAFHDDTSEERYDHEAAALAWERTIAFLRESLE
jgi:carboxymethylenebutenolidase